MKILALRLAGFGPFRGEQRVDFTAFDDDGLFLITGRTGAGKSSILDAVCYALYGRVPRYDGAAAGSVRSHHCGPDDPTFVELDFEIDGTRYRVHRTCDYDRPKKRGEGTTPVKAEVLLSRRADDGDASDGLPGFDGLDDGAYEAIAAKAKDVELALHDLLPVNADQFRQIILLAQNRFAEFLHASTAQRRELLQKLFGTLRFTRLEQQLAERAKALRERVVDARTRLTQLADGVAATAGAELDQPVPSETWFAEARLALETRVVTAELEHETAAVAARSALDAVQAAEAVHALQVRRRAAADRLPPLEAAAAGVADLRESVAVAHRAEPVQPRIVDAHAALVAVTRAADDADRVTAAWEVLATDVSADAAVAAIDARAAELGGLDELVREERTLPRLATDADTAAAAVEAHDERMRGEAQRVAELPAVLERVDDELRAAAVAAAALPDAERDTARLDEALAYARSADGIAEQLADARRRQLDATAAVAAAVGRQGDLIARRLADRAGDLAAALQPGEPCAVCGSHEHPAPAQPTHEPVTDVDLDEARSEYDRCDRALRTATAAADALAADEHRAREGAGGVAATELESARADAVTRVDAARSAAGLEARLAERKRALAAEQDALADAGRAAASERDLLVTRREAARAALTAARERVHAAYDGYAGVAERVAALRAELAAARALADGRAALTAATDRADGAATALAEALAAAGFDSADAAAAARLTAAELDDRERRIRSHDEELAVVRATLADPELAGLPDTPVETAPLRAIAEATAADRERLGQELAVLRGDAVRQNALVDEALRVLAAAAALVDESERVGALAAAVQGREPNTRWIRLETYVLAAQLEEIIVAANLRLSQMTGTRYVLQLDDDRQYRNAETGLGLRILDEHTGTARSTMSLSGGETFLASLALALGLAEVVSQQAGGVRLDTLFVDEGFGSLDGETLEAAMEALDALRAGGRTVGVISHVESMKEEIPAKLEVRVTARGDSEVAAQVQVG